MLSNTVQTNEARCIVVTNFRFLMLCEIYAPVYMHRNVHLPCHMRVMCQKTPNIAHQNLLLHTHKSHDTFYNFHNAMSTIF